jgi:ABC-type phosphate transport system permease subunit
VTIAFAAATAVLATTTGVFHSMIGEKTIFAPLEKEEHAGVLNSQRTRSLVRLIWHMPSITWVTIGFGIFVARLNKGNTLLSAVAIVLFAVPTIGNLYAYKRLARGNIALALTTSLVLLDLVLNQ